MTPQQNLSNILMEIAKQPIDTQHRIKNTAEAVTEFLREKGPEGCMALALVAARFANTGVL
jgi:hypothetical protein